MQNQSCLRIKALALFTALTLFVSCNTQENCTGGRPVNRKGAVNLSGQWQAVENWMPVSSLPVQGLTSYPCSITTRPDDPLQPDVIVVGTDNSGNLLAYLDTVTGCITIPRQVVQDKYGSRQRIKTGSGQYRGDTIFLKYRAENWKFSANVELLLTR